MRFVFACCVLLFAGCTETGADSVRYADYAGLKTSRFADELPSTLVPVSARDILVVYHTDTADIEASFSFAPADAEHIMSPFRSPDQIRLHELELSGKLPPSRVRDPLFVRCRDWGVEYLQITNMAHARYWTSHDQQLRKMACTPVNDAPMISV